MKRSAAAILMIEMLSVIGWSQTKTGTTIGQFLLIEPSARIAAMGGAGVAATSEAFASYYNAASLGELGTSDIQFAHNVWFAGISLNYAQVAIRFGTSGTGLLSVTQLSSGEIDVRTVEQPEGTGERYTVSDLALGVGYGVRVTDRFSCGLLVNYIEERIWHSRIALVGINLGTLYELSPDGLRIGASLSNFGSRNNFVGTDLRVRYDVDSRRFGDNSSVPADLITDDYGLPILFRAGISYPLNLGESSVIRMGAEAHHPNDNSESISLGAEYEFEGLLALRVGYQNLFMTDSEVGWTAGGGMKAEQVGLNVRFDYAWSSHTRLGNVQRITLGFGF